MKPILLLSGETVDKIAAGEVVERPVNAVKELVENAIDSNANRIYVEIKNGGIDYIRVSDNGEGIERDQVRKAFLRHATSKILSISDLDHLVTLGFRGEALSSISAVSKTEMITKRSEDLLATHIEIDGGKEALFEEIGAPNGTSIIVSSLFYNTPVRKKFLKSPQAEGIEIEAFMERISLSHPEISFTFLMNGKEKFITNGNGSLKDAIYRIYGKNIFDSLVEVSFADAFVSMNGFICRPEINYGTRENETIFINQRLVRSKEISIAVEEGFHGYMMQHRFPFFVLMLNFEPGHLDVNVHPQKMEVKFTDKKEICDHITKCIEGALSHKELIPEVELQEVVYEDITASDDSIVLKEEEPYEVEQPVQIAEPVLTSKAPLPFETNRIDRDTVTQKEEIPSSKYEQKTLFSERLISDAPIKKYRVIDEIFDTYWLITLDDSLYIVDQHAAHEKVNYETFLDNYMNDKDALSQMMFPPAVFQLTYKEELALKTYGEIFAKIGFEIEEFGDKSVTVRAVPMNLFGVSLEEYFLRLLDELVIQDRELVSSVVLEKIASMSCKAAIKGGNRISKLEMEQLMEKLMKLKNPYHCPHGRPVFIEITKSELEKKFKRIV